MDNIGPPHFDGTGFQRWKVLMEAHLQAKGLNVWRVTSEGKKSKSQQELQYDAIARSTLLISLGDHIFNRVFTCKDAHELWTTINENHSGTKEVANERHEVLIEKFNSFKQHDDENVESMYARLITLVNEINALGVKEVKGMELSRKILSSLRRPDYDLVKSILYKGDLSTMTPNTVMNKIAAHELQFDMKPKSSPSSSSPSPSVALASNHAKKMRKKASKKSSCDEDEHDCEGGASSNEDEHDRDDDSSSDRSSSDEDDTSELTKHLKKLIKSLEKINLMGYNLHLKEGRHHQRVKIEKIDFKKKEKKERRSRHKAHAAFGGWNDNDKDYSNLFTTRTLSSSSSPSPMCLMVQGMGSDVSDDESDSPSYDDLLNLIREQQGALKKQTKELNALKESNAPLVTNYENLLCKFELLNKEHDELKLRFESIKKEYMDSLMKMEQAIPCAIDISRVDASTSCIDLIDESCSPLCNEKCHENFVVETCDDFIAKENDELKQEVERLMRHLANLKGKSTMSTETQVQPSQDNRDHMVNKLEKGVTVTCFKCHKEGHKSFKCPQVKKMNKDEKKNNFTIKSSLIYTKPNRKNKIKSNPYMIKKKSNGKVVAHKVGEMKKKWGWNQPIWVPKEVINNMKGPQMVWVPKNT